MQPNTMPIRVPVWEIDVTLGDQTYTFLTTEEQRTYEYDEIKPVGYLSSVVIIPTRESNDE